MVAEGECIAGRYRLHGLLGEGGMASVWRADDLRLDRPVAVKFLDTRASRDTQEATEQFLREAKIAAAVSHRNVIQTVDFGTTDSGQPFMVMELLHGRTLAARITLPPPLSVEESVRIALLTLRGLAKVHQAGIVHRDLKPDNIFLVEDADGAFPKILDFGISRSVDPNSGRKSALTTSDGLIVGTPEYMSPEQARGLRDLDLRTDIYAMGVILYECLTGKRPYESEHTGDLIIMVVNGGAPPVIQLRPDVGQQLSDVIAKAMARKRDDRFRDVREMQRALEAAAEATLDDGIRRTQSMMPPPNEEAGSEYELPSSDPEMEALPGIAGRNAATLEVDNFASASAAARLLAEHAASAPRNPSPTQRGIESWTEIRRAHANPWPRRLAVAAAVVSVVVLAIWALAPQDDIEVTPIAAAPSPRPAPLEPHVVELQGLPAGATILLDGKAAAGPHVELPPGEDQKHTIQVLAPGMMPWFVMHGPGSQHRYDVIMMFAPPSTEADEAAQANATKRSRAGSTKSASKIGSSKTASTKVTKTPVHEPEPPAPTKVPSRPTKQAAPPTAFRDLDF